MGEQQRDQKTWHQQIVDIMSKIYPNVDPEKIELAARRLTLQRQIFLMDGERTVKQRNNQLPPINNN